MMKEKLLGKIKHRNLIVGVVGLGYVGLPLAVEKAKAGFFTVGFDIQPVKVEMVNNGQNYIGDVVDADLENLVKQGKFAATSDFSFVKDVDFIAICVPTPLDAHQQPDISCVRDSASNIARYLKRETIVVLESTTYPGTTEELIKPILEQGSGLTCGEDFYLGFSPERVDPGNVVYKTKNTPKVVGAIGADAQEVISYMYRQVLQSDVKEVSSPAVAEMEKILENTYRNVNIALINEIAILCNKMHINVWEVIEAAKTKPYGFQAFYPGPGLGGHCIPLDPYYLSWKAREYEFHTTMIEAAGKINDNMPDYCVERISRMLNRHKKTLNGAKVLVLGVAYKQDISDYRESPAIRVIEGLEEQGATVSYYDPFVREYIHGTNRKTGLEELTEQAIEDADIVVVTTAHTAVDYAFVARSAKLVFDAKNAMRDVPDRTNVDLL